MAKKRVSRKKPTTKKKRSPVGKKTAARSTRKSNQNLHDDNASVHYTGRMIATIMDTDNKKAIKSILGKLHNATGLSDSTSNVAYSGSSKAGRKLPPDVNYQVLEKLGIIVLNDTAVGQQTNSASFNPESEGVVLEREMWNYPLGFEVETAANQSHITESSLTTGGDVSNDYLLGMRDAIDLILKHRQGERGLINTQLDLDANALTDIEQDYTWGLRATGVTDTMLSGAGVKVAVLDSGFDSNHPDFANRTIVSKSFIDDGLPDNDEFDIGGHGTHCIGTACGPKNPESGPRYGIAYNADIYNGKVLHQPSPGAATKGADAWVLAGIEWAMQNGCQIISLSLGTPLVVRHPPTNFEKAAKRALQNGSLILAAAGNDSRRNHGRIKAVARPANCKSILTVGAVDSELNIAYFSNRHKFDNGGEVDLTGPGVNIRSSAPSTQNRTAVYSGTSMATPHAAGIAALICEQTGLTGLSLYEEMAKRALALGDQRDFGRGLVRPAATFT